MFGNFHCVIGRPNYRQAFIAAIGLLLSLTVFIAVERLVTPRHLFVMAVESYVPFIPLSWLIYILFFPFVVVISAYASADRFQAFVIASGIAIVAGFACFLLIPESVPRPDVASIENAFLRQRLSRLWGLDLPSNGFPSLHVAITCLACRMRWGYRYAWPVAGMGLLICLSTLTVKQHTLADVLGGLLLSVLSALLVERWRAGGESCGHA